MNLYFLSAFFGRVKGNRVRIPNDPVTVNAESAANAIVPWNEKARQAEMRKSGNLLRRNDVYLPCKVPHLRQDRSYILVLGRFSREKSGLFAFIP